MSIHKFKLILRSYETRDQIENLFYSVFLSSIIEVQYIRDIKLKVAFDL